MAETCTYRTDDHLDCTQPATHVSQCRWDQVGVWTSILAIRPVDWGHHRVHIPEFCAEHADVVSDARMARWQAARHD